MNTSPLPQELLDYIIDFVHEDKIALKNCSVASRSFQSAVSWHLFHTIFLSGSIAIFPTEKLKQLATTLRGSPRIRKNVQELHLAPSLRVRRAMSSKGNQHAIEMTVLSDVLERLDRLRVVVIRSSSIQLSQDSLTVRPLPHARLNRVVLGTLHSSTGYSPSRLWDLLPLFANTRIDQLEVLGQWKGTPPAISHTVKSMLRVSSLIFHERSPEATPMCLDVIRQHLDPRPPKALHVTLLASKSIQSLDALIADVGQNIETLKLDFVGMKQSSEAADVCDDLHASRICKNLHMLQFSVTVCTTGHYPLTTAILSLLSQVLSSTSHSMRSVVIVVEYCRRSHSKCIAGPANTYSSWEGIRKALSSCVGLKSAVVEVAIDWEIECPDAYKVLIEAFANVAIVRRMSEFSMLS